MRLEHVLNVVKAQSRIEAFDLNGSDLSGNVEVRVPSVRYSDGLFEQRMSRDRAAIIPELAVDGV